MTDGDIHDDLIKFITNLAERARSAKSEGRKSSIKDVFKSMEETGLSKHIKSVSLRGEERAPLTQPGIYNALPWPQPEGTFDSDGPLGPGPCLFKINDVEFRVTMTEHVGLDTGRHRFRVECLTCNTLIHKATTSASIRVGEHMLEKHAVET